MPLRVVQAWWIGRVNLAKNDLHPHPRARAGCMICLAFLFGIEVWLFGHLRAAGVGWGGHAACLGAVMLAMGLMSWMINHHWRDAFF